VSVPNEENRGRTDPRPAPSLARSAQGSVLNGSADGGMSVVAYGILDSAERDTC
jgi:hypothetical protein